MNSKIRGGCACRAVRYEIAGDPQFQCQCQCSTCQRITGTGHSDALGFSEGAVSIAGTLSFYQAAGDSGKSVSRGFCPKCGSPLLWKFAALPGLVLITAGSLDDPSMFKPQAVLYTSAGHAWDHVDPELPKFEKLWPRD
jgi:hypothetical protein